MPAAQDWSPTERQNVKRALREHRINGLGFKTKAAFYEARLPDDSSLQRIISDLENAKVGRRYDPDTLIRVERAYGLGSGAIDRIRAGEAPVLTDEITVSSDLPSRAELLEEKRRRLKAMVDALPDDQIDRVRRDVAKVLAEEE